MEGFPTDTAVEEYDTDEGETRFLLDNQSISHTTQKSSILSVTEMRAYGQDADNCPTISNRNGKKGSSSLATDVHKVTFKLHDGLQMVYMRKSTEDELKYYPVVLLTSDMVQNLKDLIDHYLDHKITGTWDPDNSKTVMDINMRDIIK